jgi:hypothetical protein
VRHDRFQKKDLALWTVNTANCLYPEMLKPIKIKYGKKRILKTSSNIASTSSLFDSIVNHPACDKENTIKKSPSKKQLLQRQVDACCILQSKIRLKNIGKRDRAAFLCNRSACLLIQRVWRGYHVRSLF